MRPTPEFLTRPDLAYRSGMIVAFHALGAPSRKAILSPHGDRSFAELNGRSNQLVNALRARGLKAGDGVALLCTNRPEFAEVYSGALRAGLRLSCINWHLQPDEVDYIVDDCEAKALIADASVAQVAVEVAQRRPRSLIKLAVGGSIRGFESYDMALDAESSEDIPDPTAGRSMLYTSGTTGRPKGVHHPLRAQTAAATAAAASGTFESRMRFIGGESLALCTGPLYHAAPLAYSLALPLLFGVGTVLMERWDAEEMLRLIEAHCCTHTHVVATMFHRLLALPEEVRSRYDVSSLRHVLHGAAPTPVHVKRAVMEWLGPIVHEYYAGTEGGGTSIGPEEWLEKPGSVGRPIAGREVVILDDSGAPVPTRAVGRVFFSIPETGGFEYFKDPEKTAAAYQGKRFTLGDHGYLDEDGYLFLTGRTSEVIISGGVNIYPAEVDEALLRHRSVADAATVGVPNDEFGEEVKAVVVLEAGREASPALASELIEFCRSQLAHFKCPRSIDFVDQLPRSDAGKLYRRLVREPYWEGRGRSL